MKPIGQVVLWAIFLPERGLTMKIINRLYQIENLEHSKKLGKELSEHIKDIFFTVYKNVEVEQSIYSFDLNEYGQIIILEQLDNLRDLSEIGLKHENGILDTIPEYVELKTYDSKQFYECIVVCNNEYALSIIASVGMYDNEIERWFRSELQ